MERKLYKAAVKGDVPSLLQLLNEDELLLDRSMVAGNTTETPLHVAAMLGHLDFVNKLLELKPQLASELDSQRSTPLHLAAAKGYADVAKSLMIVNSETCLSADKYGRNPTQVAAVKGKVEVLMQLIKARPDAAKSVTGKGETILHMCVKYNQLECLMVLVRGFFGEDDEFVNRKDGDGNSVLHLAAIEEQTETMDFLMKNTKIDVESVNHHGLKARDLLSNTWRSTRDTEAGKMNQQKETKEKRVPKKSKSIRYSWNKLFRKKNNWVLRMRESLMVVAILTATMAFQAGLNPPSGVWQENHPPLDDTTSQENYPPLDDTTSNEPTFAESPQNLRAPFFFPNKPGKSAHFIGFSVMADNFPTDYAMFLGVNTLSFLASLSVILLLISGLPTQNRFFMLILMVVMWTAITSIALTYGVSIAVLTPEHERHVANLIIQYLFYVWLGLMILLLLSHAIRLIIKMIRKIIRAIFPKKRRIRV